MSADSPIPVTRYAESDGLSIAYQVFGGGTQDLLIMPGIAFEPRGAHSLKGVPGEWQLYRALAAVGG